MDSEKDDEDVDIDPGRLSLLPECRCASDLVLSDGTSGDCNEDGLCLVVESPCVAIGENGEVERSAPVMTLNGLIHKSDLMCKLRI
jgi:hypothetical protein